MAVALGRAKGLDDMRGPLRSIGEDTVSTRMLSSLRDLSRCGSLLQASIAEEEPDVVAWMRNWSTFTKLMAAFGLLCITMAAIGTVAVTRLDVLQDNTRAIYASHLLPTNTLSAIDNDLQRLAQTSYMMFTPVGADAARSYVGRAWALDRDMLDRIAAFQATPQT